ncbi:MAG: hypothetical protein HC883_01470 [Bdellovibrionaceae bacterium]|nr:hypothetical protein [Pseudobdellovibrionaceae bacterium]
MVPWVVPAMMLASTALSATQGSKSQSKAAKETTKTDDAPWSALQPYLIGKGKIPSYLTESPALNPDWLARLQALGAGELPTGGGPLDGPYPVQTGATPKMIDQEAMDARKAAEPAPAAPTKTLTPQETAMAAKLYASQNAGKPYQIGPMADPYNPTMNVYGSYDLAGAGRPEQPSSDALYDVYQQYLKSQGRTQ